MKDCYSVTTYSVQSILGLIESGDIAIPEIQRPFVWDSTKVRDLVDSLYHGYPTGYLITWKNPDVKIKGGGVAEGKTVLIDGQQRVTALTAALAGKTVLNDDYESKRVKIAFNPLYEGEGTPFAVLTPVIEKDSRWISDIAEFFAPDFDSWSFVNDYIQANPDCNPKIVNSRITDLKAIATRQLGCIVVAAECSIDEVTDIFIRINSKGAVLSQADFAMSKIAADEAHGGNMLRKAIDYYCHLSVKPEFWATITENDAEFMASEYAAKAAWLKDDKDDIYDPDYNDVLRVAFMHMFRRGKLADLVSLLSGRDFEARDFKSEIADASFAKLHDGVIKFMHKGNFQDFTAALRSAGFISPAIIGSKGAVNFAYNLYLTLKEDSSIPSTDVKRWVQRWYVMSVLTGRYSGSSESIMDRDMRGIADRGFVSFYNEIAASQLSDNFWSVTLPQSLTTTSIRTGAWMVYVASQVRAADNTLFTNGFKVADVIGNVGDIHHIFPKAYLRKEIDAPQRLYNQIANYTYLEKRINIAIGEKSPGEYFSQARAAIIEGKPYFGDISDEETLALSLKANCIPEGVFHMTAKDYETFLAERRALMAQKIRRYFEGL
ncbi:GmrSD restriction endonuclease domain-containing protein [Collinsella bouchesdurhonensis]|uniref:GmrSD restriction endonuclease domain-containing protein n=1 Tax=Collinsella bouchesdurhonensis TaxID=1907654 RepID=UPI003F8B09B0